MRFPLVGNERLQSSVDSFINSNRIPHALLIEGERGIGKHARADYITKAAVCVGEDAGRGLGGGSALAGCRGQLHAWAVVAMEIITWGGLIQSLATLRIMGTRFLIVSYL